MTSILRGSRPEGVGGDLGHEGVHAGTHVVRGRAYVGGAVGEDADCGACAGAACSVGGGGHAVADEVVAFAKLAGLGVTGRLDQPKRWSGLGVAVAQVLGGPGVVAAGIFFGVVDEAKLDGIHVELHKSQLVEGALEGSGAGGLAGGARISGYTDVHVD